MHLHLNGCAPRLALKLRHTATRKWAIDFASEYVNIISPSERKIIMHAKQTLLFSSDAPWVKKDACEGLFDVTMGSYDGAESCELVMVYMLDRTEKNLRRHNRIIQRRRACNINLDFILLTY